MDQFFDSKQRGGIFKALMAVFILLAVFLAVQSLNALKESSYIGKGTYPANIISVNGTGEAVAIPDTGSLSFSVVEEGKTVKEAQDKASAKVNSIISAIKAMGIEEKDIKTLSYNSYPKYEYAQASMCTNGYCPPSKQILTGYEVNQNVSVKIRKTADAGAVLTKIGDLGATNISGLDFVVDDVEKIKAEARDKAVQDAKAKAQTLAKSLGVRLSKIVSFTEAGDYPGPIYYAMDAKGGVGMEANQASVPPQIPTGENKVTSNVTITYEVN